MTRKKKGKQGSKQTSPQNKRRYPHHRLFKSWLGRWILEDITLKEIQSPSHSTQKRMHQRMSLAANTTDRTLCDLPHPRRSAQLCMAYNAVGILPKDALEDLIEMLAYKRLSLAQIEQETLEDPRFYEFWEAMGVTSVHNALIGHRGSEQMVANLLFVTLDYIQQEEKIFTLTDAVNDAMLNTDLSEGLSTNMLQLPFPCCYLEFGTTRGLAPLTVYNDTTGEHPLDGCYIRETVIKASDMAVVDYTADELGFKHDEDVREIFMLWTGVPQPGATMGDDSNLYSFFYFPADGDDVDLKACVEKQLELNAQTRQRFGASGEGYKALFEHTVKCLTYINSDALRRDVRELDEAERHRNAAGLSKRKAAIKKANQSVNRIYIGPDSFEYQKYDGYALEHTGRTVRPHMRRGHLRAQAYGEGRRLRKPVLISPVMVMGGKSSDGPDSTQYIIN
ncbi:hypothetical protein [Neptuniibacter sp. QD37_11]|uniref:hypothetical protein n=1 Tax=Neptuniibacter sp. QD37_11 TaxID=3398209 RepID=UPI0039F60B81